MKITCRSMKLNDKCKGLRNAETEVIDRLTRPKANKWRKRLKSKEKAAVELPC